MRLARTALPMAGPVRSCREGSVLPAANLPGNGPEQGEPLPGWLVGGQGGDFRACSIAVPHVMPTRRVPSEETAQMSALRLRRTLPNSSFLSSPRPCACRDLRWRMQSASWLSSVPRSTDMSAVDPASPRSWVDEDLDVAASPLSSATG